MAVTILTRLYPVLWTDANARKRCHEQLGQVCTSQGCCWGGAPVTSALGSTAGTPRSQPAAIFLFLFKNDLDMCGKARFQLSASERLSWGSAGSGCLVLGPALWLAGLGPQVGALGSVVFEPKIKKCMCQEKGPPRIVIGVSHVCVCAHAHPREDQTLGSLRPPSGSRGEQSGGLCNSATCSSVWFPVFPVKK